MRVRIERFAEGAREAARRGDVVVIADALRASVTVPAALAAGAARVVPVLEVEEAAAFLSWPGYRVAGERGGERLAEFHYGNSPLELLARSAELRGRTLILTTSNGTRCVDAAAGAPAILMGSLPNLSAASAAAATLARELGRDLSVVAAGRLGREAVEDEHAARALARRLEAMGARAEPALPPWEGPDDPARMFVESGSGRRLAELGYAEDVRFCARADALSVAPLHDGSGFVPYR